MWTLEEDRLYSIWWFGQADSRTASWFSTCRAHTRLQLLWGLRLVRAVLAMEIKLASSFQLNSVQSNRVGVNAVEIILVSSCFGQSTRNHSNNVRYEWT